MADEVVEEDEETTAEMATDHMVVSAPRCGATGASPTPTISKIAGKRTITTNDQGEAIKTADLPATNAEKWVICEETVQRGEIEMEMEAGVEMEVAMETEMEMDKEMEVEVVSMVKAMEMETDPMAKAMETEMDPMAKPPDTGMDPMAKPPETGMDPMDMVAVMETEMVFTDKAMEEPGSGSGRGTEYRGQRLLQNGPSNP